MTLEYRVAKEISCEVDWDERFHRHYTSIWHVLDDYDRSPAEVVSASGIPAYGSSFTWFADADVWASCVGVKSKPIGPRVRHPTGGKDRQVFQATVKHTSDPQHSSPDDPRLDPLDDPAEISGSYVGIAMPMHRDKDDAPVQNSAKQPYVPAPEVDDAYDTLRIKINTATIDLASRASYRGKVNSGTMWGLAVRQVKLARWDWAKLYRGSGLSYIQNTYEFHISYQVHAAAPHIGPASKIGWYTTLPDTGELYYEGGVFDVNHENAFADIKDHPKGEPGKLAATGDALDPSLPTAFNVYLLEREANLLLLPGVPAVLPVP